MSLPLKTATFISECMRRFAHFLSANRYERNRIVVESSLLKASAHGRREAWLRGHRESTNASEEGMQSREISCSREVTSVSTHRDVAASLPCSKSSAVP